MKIIALMLLCLGLVCFTSCRNNVTNSSDTSQDTVLSYDETFNHGAIEMSSLNVTDSVVYKGHVYTYNILRVSDSTLARVKDPESQNIYLDNRVELKIMRDGADFYVKTFTKTDFEQFLDEGFRTNGLLEGFVFDDTADEGLRFATSVSYPQSDMYISLTILVKADKSVVIAKDNLIDSAEETE